jgi:hypothetical protein
VFCELPIFMSVSFTGAVKCRGCRANYPEAFKSKEIKLHLIGREVFPVEAWPEETLNSIHTVRPRDKKLLLTEPGEFYTMFYIENKVPQVEQNEPGKRDKER